MLRQDVYRSGISPTVEGMLRSIKKEKKICSLSPGEIQRGLMRIQEMLKRKEGKLKFTVNSEIKVIAERFRGKDEIGV